MRAGSSHSIKSTLSWNKAPPLKSSYWSRKQLVSLSTGTRFSSCKTASEGRRPLYTALTIGSSIRHNLRPNWLLYVFHLFFVLPDILFLLIYFCHCFLMFWLFSRLVCYFIFSRLLFIISSLLCLSTPFFLCFLLLPSFFPLLPSVFLYRFAFPPSQPNLFPFFPFVCFLLSCFFISSLFVSLFYFFFSGLVRCLP